MVHRGFARDWTEPSKVVFLGRLDPMGLNVRVSAEVSDFDFVRFPQIRLREAPAGSARQLPHVLSGDGTLCYFVAGSVVLDRYDPGGTVVQCLEKAEAVLRDAVRGRLDADFAEEFYSFWDRKYALVDLPPDFAGPAKMHFLRITRDGAETPALCLDNSWMALSHERGGSGKPASEPCLVVKSGEVLTLDPSGDWPPANLEHMNVWLAKICPSLVGKVEAAMVKEKGPLQWLAIVAPNGFYFFRISLPRTHRTKEFLENRRKSIPRLLASIGSKVATYRTVGYRADTGYIFERNMGQDKNLCGKKILLIGCGTIGGFLAHQLAQSGAGAEGGSLHLVDNDSIKTANLGRHLLGVPYLLQNKAVGCRDFISEQLPMLDVQAHGVDISDFAPHLSRFDLVIDATGEEALSIALNQKAVDSRPNSPPFLFAWLLGNGAAAQSLITGEPEYACFKCLKPDLSGAPRFRVLKTDTEIATERNVACGDGTYIPFPVSRSVVAASLACEHALDWANGRASPRFRTRTLDARRANFVKDGSPHSLAACPACGGRA